jgi:hypothetical protein
VDRRRAVRRSRPDHRIAQVVRFSDVRIVPGTLSRCSRLDRMKLFWDHAKMLRAFVILFTLVAVLLVGARLYGAYRWNVRTQYLRARLNAARVPVRPHTVDFGELQDLPAPVRRYFREVLKEGQPMVAGVHVWHTGTCDEEGLIEAVRADARGRTVGGEVVPTPWQGRFWNYEERCGMRVPLYGEVAWMLPEGEKPYWRGRITEIACDFAR